jgi:hypothetical protein
MKKKLVAILIVFMIGVMAVASSCVGNYAVYAHNMEEHAILLLKVGEYGVGNTIDFRERPGEEHPIIARLPPEQTGNAAYWLGRLNGYKVTLPLKMEVIWQIAERSECRVNRADASYSGGYERRGCKWTPIPGKIYRKELSLLPLRGTAAYWKSGLPNPSTLFSSYSLKVHLIFNEGQLDVETEAWASNPWN